MIFAGDVVWTIGGDHDPLKKAIADSRDQIHALSRTMLTAGGAITAGFVGIGVAAVSVADEVNQATGKMEAALGIPHDLALRLADDLKTVYGDNFADSIEDAGQAITDTFTQLSRATDAPEEGIVKITEAALGLRDAFEVEVSQSTAAAATLMEEFGLTGDQAMDFVTAGFQRGLNASDDFLESINEYATQFSNGGANASQFFSILSTGLQGGVLGTDKAADAFKEFRVRIQDGSTSTAEALESIGISSVEMAAKFADGSITAIEAFDLVIDKLGDVEDSNLQFQAGVALLGTQFEDLGQDAALALDSTRFSVEDLAGSTDKLNAQYDSLGSALEGLKRKALLALEPIGQGLLTVINDHLPQIQAAFDKLAELAPKFTDIFASGLDFVLDKLIPTVSWVIEFAARNDELVIGVTTVIGILGGLAAMFGTVGFALSPLVKTVGLLSGGLGATGFQAVGASQALFQVGGAASGAIGVAGGGGVLGLAGALAGPVGLAAAVGFTVLSIGKLLESMGDLAEANRRVARAAGQGAEQKAKLIDRLIEEGVALDRATLEAMTHAEVNQLTRKVMDERRGSTEKLTNATEKEGTAQRNLNREGDVGIGTLAQLGSSASRTAFDMERLEFATRQAVAALRDLQAVRAAGGGIPQAATGGLVTFPGVVDVHANERIFLPGGADIIPAKHSAQIDDMLAALSRHPAPGGAGHALSGGRAAGSITSSVDVGGITIVVPEGVVSKDNLPALAGLINDMLGRELSDRLGAGLGILVNSRPAG